MALSPIAFIAPNYRDFKNYWLKAYEQGTTTPVPMALDSEGLVTVSKLELNSDGFLKSAGGTLVIPYIDGSYDAWLFPTEAAADANDTVNAEQIADNITGVNGDILATSVVYKQDTLDDAVNETSTLKAFVGSAANIKERTTGNGGGAMWDYITVGTTPNVDLPNTYNIVQCVGVTSLALKLRVDSILNIINIVDNRSVNTAGAWNHTETMSISSIKASDNYLIETDVTITKEIIAPDTQIFSITSGTVILNGNASLVSSLWFAPDPWDSFKKAQEVLSNGEGGTILVAKAIYNADKPMLVNATVPINILGNMWNSGIQDDTALLSKNYITPKSGLLTTDNIIEYSGTGGGKINGLYFVDDNDILNATQKNRRVIEFNAAIKLTKYNLSKMSEIHGLYLNASLIETQTSVMSSIKDVWVRRCGGINKPSINIDDTTGISQSLELSSIRAEVNYDDDYIKIAPLCKKIKVANVGFETDLSEPDTFQTFINNQGISNDISHIHLNRNDATKLIDSGSFSVLSNISSETAGLGGVILSTGKSFKLSNYNGINNTSAIDEILCTGLDAELSNITTSTGGGVRSTGANSLLSNISIIALQDATNSAIEIGSQSILSGASVRSSVAVKDLVYINGSASAVSGVMARDCPSTMSCIKTGGSFNSITGNNLIAASGATGIDTSANANNAVIGNVAQGVGTKYNLSGTDITTGNI